MNRVAAYNIAWGFLVIGIISCAGAILSFDVTESITHDPANLLNWQAILQKSAHAHGNLFGMLHILFGLTLIHSKFSLRIKFWQSFGIFLGTLAAGPLMWIRSFASNPGAMDFLTYLVSAFFSAALFAIFSHSLGVLLRFGKRV